MSFLPEGLLQSGIPPFLRFHFSCSYANPFANRGFSDVCLRLPVSSSLLLFVYIVTAVPIVSFPNAFCYVVFTYLACRGTLFVCSSRHLFSNCNFSLLAFRRFVLFPFLSSSNWCCYCLFRLFNRYVPISAVSKRHLFNSIYVFLFALSIFLFLLWFLSLNFTFCSVLPSLCLSILSVYLCFGKI